MLSMILAAYGSETDNDSVEGKTGEDSGIELGKKDLSLPYVAWAREMPVSYLLAAILEDVGYNVDLKQVEAGPMWSSVADGSADFTSVSLPIIHGHYWDEYKDDVVKVKQVLDKSPNSLAVPSYMEDVNSIEDLKDNAALGEQIDWTITGIDGGSGIMTNTEKAMTEYGLDKWDLLSSSEAAMLTELTTAIENKEPIVFPLWKPHWIFNELDLKMLDDPKEIYGGDGDQIYIITHKGFEEEAPAAYKILEQYKEDNDMLEELMTPVYKDDKDPADVAQQFMEDNPDLIEEWTKGLK